MSNFDVQCRQCLCFFHVEKGVSFCSSKCRDAFDEEQLPFTYTKLSRYNRDKLVKWISLYEQNPTRNPDTGRTIAKTHVKIRSKCESLLKEYRDMLALFDYWDQHIDLMQEHKNNMKLSEQIEQTSLQVKERYHGSEEYLSKFNYITVDGVKFCRTCKVAAVKERDPDPCECHVCRDWGSCKREYYIDKCPKCHIEMRCL